MIENYLHPGYQSRIRSYLKVDDKLLPDSIIDAELNIKAADITLSGVLESCVAINSPKRERQVAEAAERYLTAVLCVMLKSRTKVPPYDKPWRDWEYWRKKSAESANSKMMKLFR